MARPETEEVEHHRPKLPTRDELCPVLRLLLVEGSC